LVVDYLNYPSFHAFLLKKLAFTADINGKETIKGINKIMAKKITKKAEAEVKQAVETVGGLTAHDVITEIGNLQVDVQSTLAHLSATITSKLGAVAQIDSAIVAKKEQLQELYGIDAEATKLEEIKSQREAEESKWVLSDTEHNTLLFEEKTFRDKEWAREEEEHVYSVARRRQRAEEDHKGLLEAHQRQEKYRQELLDRNWTDRENSIRSQEAEIGNLRETVQGFDSRLKDEVAKAEAILGSRMKRQYEQETILLKKDMEVSDKLCQSEKLALVQTIQQLQGQISGLNAQLQSARNDVKEVTNQALQAASDKMASAAIQRMADTQAQNSKGSK
jgi:hypothetical protein